ncbi:MAG: oligosaccharide flippase family protein [Pirellulales bacterium]
MSVLGGPAAARPRGTGALVAAGTFWLLAQTLGSKAVTLVGQLVLAWLLAPEDFGQIGLAYTVTAFVALLINPGIDVILVRRGRRFHLWSTSAFYFSLVAGLLGCVAILVAAPLVARVYESPQLVGLLAVLALATPLGSLTLVPTAKLRSEMRFGILSAINFLQSLIQTVLTLAFAATHFGAYSFVLPMPLVYLVISAVLWSVARPAVKLHRPMQYWRYLIGDTSYIFGQRTLLTMVVQGDYIILGALYGPEVVGPYFFAFGIATQAIRLTAGSLQLVLMAGLTRFTTFCAQQTQAALRATKALALIGMPLCMLQAAIAGPVLRALYGEKWVAAIPLIQLISVGLAFDVASWPAGSLLQSRGQFRFLFFWSLAFAPIFLVAIFVGALLGESLGVATAVCGYYLILSPLLTLVTFRSAGVGVWEIVDVYLRPVVVGLVTVGVTFAALRLSTLAGWPPLAVCGLAGSTGLLAMVAAARVIAPVLWNDVLALLTIAIQPLFPTKN